MIKAIGVYKELSDEECDRMLFEAQETARRDIASLIAGARREGRIDVALKLLKRNIPIEEIAEATGLTHKEIESFQKNKKIL